MSILRRHRILADDVRRVIGHLKAHDKITKDDIISRPRLKKKKDAGPNEQIPWSHAELAGSWQQKELKPGANNSQVLYAKEKDLWKLVVPEEKIEKFLRKAVLDPASKMPLGRDSAYHHMQKGHRHQPPVALQVPGEARDLADHAQHPQRARKGGHCPNETRLL